MSPKKTLPPGLDKKQEKEFNESSITYVTQVGEASDPSIYTYPSTLPSLDRHRPIQRRAERVTREERKRHARPEDLAHLKEPRWKGYVQVTVSSFFVVFAIGSLVLMIGTGGRFTPMATLQSKGWAPAHWKMPASVRIQEPEEDADAPAVEAAENAAPEGVGAVAIKIPEPVIHTPQFAGAPGTAMPVVEIPAEVPRAAAKMEAPAAAAPKPADAQ